MKLNTIITLLAMTVLSISDYGLIKFICWGVIFINFIVYMYLFDKAIK